MLIIIVLILAIIGASMISNSIEYKSYKDSYKKLNSNFKLIHKADGNYYFSNNPDSFLVNTIVFFKHKKGINVKLYGNSYINLSFITIVDPYKLYYYIKFNNWFKKYLKND